MILPGGTPHPYSIPSHRASLAAPEALATHENSWRSLRPRVLDLFAGAAGLTAGFHAASERFRTIPALEMDPAAAASFEATFGDGIVYTAPIQEWLESDQAPEPADIVIGGPPCQGFSLLGKCDENDLRDALERHYVETLLPVQPKYFIVENVATFLLSSARGVPL